jgi:hypothetical protein
MNAILTAGLPISSGACLDMLEQADDFAHTSVRYRQVERALRNCLPDPAAMICECREKMEMYRHTASFMADTLRWFAKNPAATVRITEYGPFTKGHALSELKLARHLNRRVAGQLGEWIRRARAAHALPFQLAAE